MEPRTIARERADLITQANIDRLQAQLEAESNDIRRAGLARLLAEQRLLLAR